MKYIFVSDIHGNIERLEQCINLLYVENADKLVILGDTASNYSEDDNIYIANRLNDIKHKVEVIRGNCDTSDFEENLDFEIFDDDILFADDKLITITHGHLYTYQHLPPNCGDIFIQGHTHVPLLINQNGRILANPGSVSRPKGADLRCYLLVNDKEIILKSIENNSEIKKIVLGNE